MKSVKDKKFRLRSSIALVYRENLLEFFKTNVRESVFLEIDYKNVIDLLLEFDGKRTVEYISIKHKIQLEFLIRLVEFLNTKYILIEVDEEYSCNYIEEKYRLINFLEDYCVKTSDVIYKIKDLQNKVVIIVGIGAVGSWIADMLVRNGVGTLILVDDDIVELSNLHRQHLYFENDIGNFKVDVAEKNLKNINTNINIIKIKNRLAENFFNNFEYDCDFIVNCADYPSVDFTTKIVSEYCMKNNIPHIVGGGYNLHLTLIGQTVIPNKTACCECFDIKLQQLNIPFAKGLKKLNRKDRKIGSFAPLSTISASLSALDIFKVLCGLEDFIVNGSKRIEFTIKEMDFNIMSIERNKNCKCFKVN